LVGSAGSVKATSGTRLLRPTAAYFPAFALVALTAAHRFFVASAMAFLPAALSFCCGFEGFAVAFDVRLECFAGGFVAVPEDACKLTASFARVTAAFAS